jgi:hypothetical protein
MTQEPGFWADTYGDHLQWLIVDMTLAAASAAVVGVILLFF